MSIFEKRKFMKGSILLKQIIVNLGIFRMGGFMNKNTTDMTVGSPVRHLLLFAIPALIGNIFQQIYNLADSIIVGNIIGADALAAVGATASITFLFFALCNGISGGGGIIVSQYYGAHDEKSVKVCITNTGLIMIIFPIVFGSVGFVSAPALLNLLETPQNILADATMYVRFMCVGLLFSSIYNFLSAILRALGDSKTPLYFLIFCFEHRSRHTVCRIAPLGCNGSGSGNGNSTVCIGAFLRYLCICEESVIQDREKRNGHFFKDDLKSYKAGSSYVSSVCNDRGFIHGGSAYS